MLALVAAELAELPVVQVPPVVATVLLGTLIPLAVGLVTKSKASSTVKETVNGIAAVLVAVITAAATAGGIALDKLIVLALTTFGSTKAAYLLFRWMGTIELVAGLLPDKGIGQPIDTTATELPHVAVATTETPAPPGLDQQGALAADLDHELRP